MSDEVLITLISTLGPVILGFFSYLSIKAGVRRYRRRRAAAGPQVDEDEEMLASFESDPRSMVLGLMKENRALRSDVDTARNEQTEMWKEIRALRKEIDQQKRDETRFRDALGRWLIDLFASWGKTDKMPWPSAADFEILRPVLPERRQNP